MPTYLFDRSNMSMNDFKIHFIQDSPFPMRVVEAKKEFISNVNISDNWYLLLSALDPVGELKLITSLFRGVNIERISQILSSGIDVVPSTSPIYAEYFDKAIEYGEFPKVLMAFNPDYLDDTYRELPDSTELSLIVNLKKSFPTEIPLTDRSMIWLTKLHYDDPRAATAYERAYAKWIPGNPFEALRAVIIITDSFQAILDALKSSKSVNG